MGYLYNILQSTYIQHKIDVRAIQKIYTSVSYAIFLQDCSIFLIVFLNDNRHLVR